MTCLRDGAKAGHRRCPDPWHYPWFDLGPHWKAFLDAFGLSLDIIVELNLETGRY